MARVTTILLADNDSSFQGAVHDFLVMHGYQVLSVQTPAEAKEFLERGDVDVAIIDVRLTDDLNESDASGIKIAREIAPHIPKIIQTSFPTYQAARDALGSQLEGLPAAIDFLDKAQGPEALLSSIARALEFAEERWPVPDPPEDLIEACTAGECVLYAGSGLSAQAGLPTWKPFVYGLTAWALSKGFIKDEFASSLREAIDHDDADSAADSIVSAVGENLLALYSYLDETFFRNEGRIPQSHITAQGIPFCAALTTNFDSLLEDAFKVAPASIHTPYDTEKLKGALLNRRFFLLKLYGTLMRPDTLLVAPAQYRASVSENILFSQFMEALFFSRTLVFIGASLEGIEAYLSGLKFRGGNTLRKHYALVNVIGHGWQARAEVLQRRFSINVLPYTATREFPEVNYFLAQLSASVKAAQRESHDAPIISETTKLSNAKLLRVRLENIGPFYDQTFDISQQWNVLLGDNGVGKSTVLKAIAVGISGEAAKDYAEHLIRNDRPSGIITLEIESEVNKQKVLKTYVTKLLRSDAGAEVQTLPTRPLEAEDWLAIGFPPLRYIGWEKKPESIPVKNVPVPADLLPLVSGEPDPRPNQIKNWLFELDHQILSDKSEGLAETRNTRLRDTFYRVISELTPGLRILPGKIDLDKQMVVVVTDDGEVPLESVSQGTVSLIGWVGVLLRRLFEVYGEQANPLEQRALVLIDEIDAHMHPAWQQLLVPQIRKLFPNVQLVSTTHSPLIVPSLETNEIIRLKRHLGTHQVEVSVTDYNVQDYRADQVLTSPLFSLESSLAPELQQQVSRYTALAVKEQLDPEEQRDLERLAYEINIKLPSPAERTEARIAYNLIQYALNKHLEELDPSLTAKITEEMKVQLQELISGSRRP